jgi:anti-sigma factor RsiW
MKLTESELRALWQQHTARSNTSSGVCLSEELLLRAGLDELTVAERQQLAAHLSGCADCAEEYRLARAAQAWARETAGAVAPKVESRAPQTAGGWRDWLFLPAWLSPQSLTLVAILLLATLGLGGWLYVLSRQQQSLQAQLQMERAEAARVPVLQEQLVQLQQQNQTSQTTLAAENTRLTQELAALTQPQLEVPIIDVDPASLTRGSGGANREVVVKIDVPATASLFTVILHLSGERKEAALLVELMERKSNQVLWHEQPQKSAAPNLTLTLAKQRYPAGQYRIRVSAVNGLRKTLLDYYDIQVNYLTR